MAKSKASIALKKLTIEEYRALQAKKANKYKWARIPAPVTKAFSFAGILFSLFGLYTILHLAIMPMLASGQ